MFLSQSEIAAWTRCPRMWFVTYYLAFQPADEPPVSNRLLGVRLHTALEGYYGYGLDPLQVLTLLYQIEMRARPEFEQDLKAELGMGLIMLSGYMEWAEQTGQDNGLQVVAVEADIQVPLPGLEKHVILRGKIDQMLVDEDTGALGFLDHKSAASFDKHQVLERDPQLRFYSLLQLLQAGHEIHPGMPFYPDPELPLVDGAWINTLRRVKRTSASKPPYYARDWVRYPPEVMVSTLQRTTQVALEIMNARGNLDEAYRHGGALEAVNTLQRTLLRPVPISGDCDWRCPLASGTCVAMDDGSDWPGILERSGRFVRADPYARYSEDPLRSIRESTG